MSGELFPTIGSLAEKTDQLPDRGDDVATGPPAEDDDHPTEEIESLCMSCGENGITRMMLTSIPYFQEVVVMSFQCDHCGLRNNEIQSAGKIREHGVVYSVRIRSRADLDRQIVRSPSCTIEIPECELTIPESKGQLTTVEGLLRNVILDLGADQPLRRIQDEKAYNKIQSILDTLESILPNDEDEETTKEEDKDAPLETPIMIKMDDPTGNSFIEFRESMADPKWNMRQYTRTREQHQALGFSSSEAEEPAARPVKVVPPNVGSIDKVLGEAADPNEEIYTFPGICSSCGAPLDTLMKKVVIPYFKDILIMSTNCERCGYRDNEVKSGSAISEKGKLITLKVEDREDLSRDILKSETCGLTIPEIELTLHAGTLGGRFTTLEGLLDQVYEELSEKVFAGDSSEDSSGDHKKFETFLDKLRKVKGAEVPFTVILEDPLANSYLQNIYAPDPDPNMTIEAFERTWDQNEDLGLNDIKVEGYEGEPEGNKHQ